MALIFKRTVYAVHPTSTQTTRRRLIAVATISMVLALSVVVASSYIFSVGVLAQSRHSTRSHEGENPTNIPQSENNHRFPSEQRGNRTSRDTKSTQNPLTLPRSSVSTTAATVEKITSSGVTKFSVVSTTTPTTAASDASTTENHRGDPKNSKNHGQANAPATMNPDLARPISETRSPSQLKHSSQTATTQEPIQAWNFTTVSSYQSPETTETQANGVTKAPSNKRNQTKTAGTATTDKNSVTQRPNDRVIAWDERASEKENDTTSTKSSTGFTTESSSIASVTTSETTGFSTESTSAGVAESLHSTQTATDQNARPTTETSTTALTSSSPSDIALSNATSSNATSSNATSSNASSSIYYQWSDRWRNFRRQWANSRAFILGHSGIVLTFSFFQFLVAASIAMCMKDSMNEFKLHLITARWICINSVIFLVLTCSLIVYALMGTDPEKLDETSRFVPHRDSSYVHANVFSKSLISNIYAVLLLADITILFILMITASCFLRRNHIAPEEYEVCD